MKNVKKAQENLGHRGRVREKFMSSLGEELHEYELLEILLFAANPRQDTKSTAKQLLKQFGDLSAIVNADIERLKEVEGIGQSAIVHIKVVAQIIQRMLKQDVRVKTVLNNWQAMLQYARALLKDLNHEVFHVLFLDKNHQLIEDALLGVGEADMVNVNPKMIVKKALLLSASSVILLHNHPAGETKPSQADIKVTNDIIMVMKGLDIKVLDHVIIAPNGYFSFQEEGLI